MLTVLMATHNGASTLPQVLESYTRLSPPEGGWRLVVVDNNSSDGTADVLKAFAEQLPLHSVRTDKRGKNIALNIGLDHVDGDLVVFTDDDAVADRAWLSSMRRVAEEQTAFDIFGGMILPIWPNGSPPEWILRLVNLSATYAISPAGIQSGPISARQVWGPNMAIRAKIFREGHRFDEGVGPQAGQYKMGSEVEFTCRLERAGCRAWFAVEAKVAHIIRPNQIEREWIIGRAYRFGRHMFQQEREAWPEPVRLFRGAPRWKYRQLLLSYVDSVVATVTSDFDRKFQADWSVSFLRGYLAEAEHSSGS